MVIAGIKLSSSWPESLLSLTAGLQTLTTWTGWLDRVSKMAFGQMMKRRERRRNMETTASRAARKSLQMWDEAVYAKSKEKQTPTYLVKVLPWLTLIDMVGGQVLAKYADKGGGGSWHISRPKVEKSGQCGSQGEPLAFSDWQLLGSWSLGFFAKPFNIQLFIFIFFL